MNTRPSRSTILVASLLTLLLFASLASLRWMQQQRAAAQQAVEDLAACQELQQAVLALRSHSTLAAAQAMESAELSQRVDHSSQLADLPPSALEGIFPQPAQRVGQLPYVEKPTTLTLRRVELPSLATFLYDLTDSPGLDVRQLHLRAPHGDAAAKQWDADATITCLIAAPTDFPRGN